MGEAKKYQKMFGGKKKRKKQKKECRNCKHCPETVCFIHQRVMKPSDSCSQWRK